MRARYRLEVGDCWLLGRHLDSRERGLFDLGQHGEFGTWGWHGLF
jgi:hypothetical protein